MDRAKFLYKKLKARTAELKKLKQLKVEELKNVQNVLLKDLTVKEKEIANLKAQDFSSFEEASSSSSSFTEDDDQISSDSEHSSQVSISSLKSNEGSIEPSSSSSSTDTEQELTSIERKDMINELSSTMKSTFENYTIQKDDEEEGVLQKQQRTCSPVEDLDDKNDMNDVAEKKCTIEAKAKRMKQKEVALKYAIEICDEFLSMNTLTINSFNEDVGQKILGKLNVKWCEESEYTHLLPIIFDLTADTINFFINEQCRENPPWVGGLKNSNSLTVSRIPFHEKLKKKYLVEHV